MTQVENRPKRLSPLHEQHKILGARFDLRDGWLIPEIYTAVEEEATVLQESVGLIDISAWGKLDLKGTQAGTVVSMHFGNTPAKPGDVIEIESNHILVAELTSDEFLVLLPPGAEKEIRTALETEIASQDTFVSLIDQTSGLAGFSISGSASAGVMKKLCALSFSSKEFPNMHVAQSSFAKVRATIIRHDQSNLPTFKLFSDRSYGEYLWDAILDAGREFGIQPVGWETTKKNCQG